jgi:hypothetical protein
VLRPLRVGCMLPHAGGREPAHRACGTLLSVAQGGDTATGHESKLCLRRVDFFVDAPPGQHLSLLRCQVFLLVLCIKIACRTADSLALNNKSGGTPLFALPRTAHRYLRSPAPP